MLSSLQLTNFTAFTDTEVRLSPRINVIVGENGTGKTHLLKAAYALTHWDSLHSVEGTQKRNDLTEAFTAKLLKIFFPAEGDIRQLRQVGSNGKSILSSTFGDDRKIEFEFGPASRRAAMTKLSAYPEGQQRPLMIPAKEVLSFLEGLSAPNCDSGTVELLFDDVYLDLSNLLLQGQDLLVPADLEEDPRIGSLVPMLSNAIGGRYHLESGNLVFEAGRYEEIENPRTLLRQERDESIIDSDSVMEEEPVLPQLGSAVETTFVRQDSSIRGLMTAEGFKKIGMLQQLLMNGGLIPGQTGPLFWDEPEANVNPTLMRLLVEVLLELSRNGQQIILATHDYVILKWLDLLADAGKDDDIRFHALYRDKDSGKIGVESCGEFRLLNQNAISD